jgi:hypothetical protein
VQLRTLYYEFFLTDHLQGQDYYTLKYCTCQLWHVRRPNLLLIILSPKHRTTVCGVTCCIVLLEEEEGGRERGERKEKKKAQVPSKSDRCSKNGVMMCATYQYNFFHTKMKSPIIPAALTAQVLVKM